MSTISESSERVRLDAVLATCRPLDAELTTLPRFLIANHNPLPRELLRRFLIARGFDVEVAVDGLQCLEQLREGRLTVLVLDPHLPWGGGNGVLECLLDEEPFQEVTVVLTNGGHIDDILPCLRPLISQFHQCPCGLHDMECFLACLERLAWRIDRGTNEATLVPCTASDRTTSEREMTY